jgi:hypothetical protein
MGKMSHIAYLIEYDKKEELIAEVTECAIAMGKTPEEVAGGFTDAYHNIRLQKNNPAFSKLNEIQDEMLEHYDNHHDESNVVYISDINKEIAKDWNKK